MPVGTPSRLDLGIGLVSFAVLLVELLLTRIFSVTMFYHLSFMVVSLAMLGLAASGLLVSLWPSGFRRERLPWQVATGALALAVTAVAAVGVAFRVPVSLELSAANWLRVALIYGLCAVPFAAGGLVVALILTHHSGEANRLYGFDLAGAALGGLVFIPATGWLGAPTAVLVATAVAAAAGAVLAGRDAPWLRGLAVVVATGLVLAAAANLRSPFYDVRVTKGARQPKMLALRWNAFSRVEVIGRPEDLWTPRRPFSAGFSTALDPEFRVPEVWLRYDADAATQITRFDGDPGRLVHLRYDVTSAPYHMRRFENVLVIGPGGGRDILTALSLGSGPVTGVEVNPLTLELMRGRFRKFTGGLYDGFPGVRVIHEEGRSFLRRATNRYDLIQASLVDTWAASAAGAYALTENSLYTVEAFEDYLSRLTPDGAVALSRWFAEPPVESLRVVVLAVEALRRHGVPEPGAHVFVVQTNRAETRQPALGTILVKRAPFTDGELARLRTWAAAMRFLVRYAPDDARRGAPRGEFHALVGPDAARFIASYPYDISPVSDERPFFFNRVPLLPWLARRLGLGPPRGTREILTLGGQTLLVSLTVTATCTLLLLLVPLVAAAWRRGEGRGPAAVGVGRRRAFLWAVYFAGVGLGYIMVEIVLIQRFTFFLGYPVYALVAVLFTMLLASGLGSALAGRWTGPRPLPRALLGLCAALVACGVVLPRLLDATLGLSTPLRLSVAVGIVAPLGLLMGVPFATGLRRVGGEAKGLVPWAWAVNGGASVFGSTLAVLVSMTYGFTASFLTGAGAYVVALGTVAWLTRTTDAHHRP
jgi:spermidine synthase